MEKTIFGYVWRFSRQQQINMTLMSAASLPFLYLFYEVPKTIINEAIQGIRVEYPLNLAEKLTVSVFGLDIPLLGPFDLVVNQTPYLYILCAVFLILVGINQGFKYVINVYKGLTGERMLRRLRFELYGRVLRFPLPTFRKMSQGEIIPMITAEVEPLGGFIGDAFSLPAFQGGYLATILAFLFLQDWRMAAAAVSLYPLQLWLIPKLQRKVNLLGKERVARVRRLSDKIGETVQGVQETHAHDTSNFVLMDFSSQLFWIYGVRERIYRQKFVIKFLNNSIQQLGPFAFYSIGGYFVITGDLEIGTLVAAIAAHKDLAAPWKELLAYYQMQADATIKYEQ
ncbi:MAG: ABC transporter ATP-binding protein, partial [Rhodospirillaceae bacterium]|nr:ABC transporter ATP-binding protein [Rhodospirillaceae bacterium]